jgi:threonine/homoserine efflux transporter RhtA
VYEELSIVVMVASLLLGAWCFVAAARHRWLGAAQVVALIAVELVLLAQAIAATVRIVDGERPGQFGTFVGYLITSVIVLPLATLLSFMERTRWGSIIAGVAALVVAVLTLRLRQVWAPA